MPEWEAVGMGVEELDRILSSLCCPIEVQLHFYEVRVGLAKEDVIPGFAALGIELEIMIVMTELDAGLLAFLAGDVEVGCHLLIMIEAAALLVREPGTDH